MSFVLDIKEKVINGYNITKEEALKLYNSPLDELTESANEIRKYFCGNKFDICTIINAKSGKCSEDCKYCAQSAFYNTNIDEYPILEKEKILKDAKNNDKNGILRYSLVTSGRCLTDNEIENVCDIVREIKNNTNIQVCVSLGLLKEEQFKKLKEAGVSRIHNNIETSRQYFNSVCTTHTFDDKLETIKAAQRAGLTVCSGGIMGIGESISDRIDMAFTLRDIGINSVPINMLNPIPGTPYENLKPLTINDMKRIVAVYRFILPKASIRLAGGRGLMKDSGKECFTSGANAAISGNMLTTSGITIETDLKLLEELGYKKELCNG